MQSPPGVVVEGFHVAFEVSDELRTKRASFLTRADGIELERDTGKAKPAPETADHRQLLEIDIGAGIAERLDAERVVLAVPSLLRSLVPEKWPAVPEPLGAVVEHVVLERGPNGRRGPFGAQRQALVMVGERIHLFFDDVGRFADGAHEKIGLFDDGCTDVAISVLLENVAHGVFEDVPQRRFVRKNVVHAADGLDPPGHGARH